jgi:hypothetical protein
MTEQSMEPPGGVESLTGEDIVQDVAQRVAAALAGNCFLRGLDSYSSYSARVTIELQLRDLDVTQVEKTLVIGKHDPGRPSQPVKVKVPEATVEAVRERSGSLPPNLERLVSGDIPAARRKGSMRQGNPRTAQNSWLALAGHAQPPPSLEGRAANRTPNGEVGRA